MREMLCGSDKWGEVSDKNLKLFKLILGGEISDEVVVVWLVMIRPTGNEYTLYRQAKLFQTKKAKIFLKYTQHM